MRASGHAAEKGQVKSDYRHIGCAQLLRGAAGQACQSARDWSIGGTIFAMRDCELTAALPAKRLLRAVTSGAKALF
jgi:hypothetical protein